MKYKTKTKLILPFKGELMVSNGGRTVETNNHIRPANQGPQNQLYAYDFRTDNTGEETSLEDYPVFGREVIAPGDGKVAQVVDGSFDCDPGEADRSVGVGNMIMLDHDNGEFSLLCHFKHNSIVVKVGEKVKQGQKLGLCGNTGNTNQPHIHYNLQDHLLGYKAKALFAQFVKIRVDGEVEKSYEPVRFQQVSNYN
jgi:hypothetical protein